MVAWKRFPIPVFDRDAFKDMEYEAPEIHSAEAAEALIARLRDGDDTARGGYAVMPGEALFDKYSIRGGDRHAVMCLLPDAPIHLLGRSWGWLIQGAVVIDSLDAETSKPVFHWKTPRPMNTRLGPEDGVSMDGGVYYVITANKYADHWLGNRSIIQNDWDPGDGRSGFRILAASDEDLEDFHDCCLEFTWQS